MPTLEEADTLPALLQDLSHLPFPVSVTVVDGGSRDETLEIAVRAGARTLRSPPGRARQMNTGARSHDAPWLLFLHADSRIPPETVVELARWLAAPPPCSAAHFDFQLDARGPWWALIERGQRLREQLTGLVYGDQGLLISRERFEEIGGIPEFPVMEDVETVRRLRRSGGIDRIPAPIVTSARRYRAQGPFLSWARNALLISLYSLGVSPRLLSRWYPARPDGRRTVRPL